MTKVKHSQATKRRKKKVLRQAKGFWGDRSKQFQQARRALMHALVYAYRDRKARKRSFRRLWISRINAAVRQEGMSYNKFMSAVKKSGIGLDRKIIAELAVREPAVFKRLFETVKSN
ncbi:MAG: 50S ribosomal protein L20 [Candidatus Omnitrophica bacterium]|nr:50S ribosomal protein L20 [Candidatus Omnitrophota bacterium]